MNDLRKDIPGALQSGIDKFSCTRDLDLEDFLKNKAFTFEDKAKSRTYLLLDKSGIENRQINIMAYFAIAPQIMYLPAELSVRQIKRLDGFSGKIS